MHVLILLTYYYVIVSRKSTNCGSIENQQFAGFMQSCLLKIDKLLKALIINVLYYNFLRYDSRFWPILRKEKEKKQKKEYIYYSTWINIIYSTCIAKKKIERRNKIYHKTH